MENFPWTRIPGVRMPDGVKPPIPQCNIRQAPPDELRRLTVDGVFGGSYQRPDSEVLEVWRTGVAEVRDLIENGWFTDAWAGRQGRAGHRNGPRDRHRDRRWARAGR